MPTVYNKVTASGSTLIDLSQDTVTDVSHIRNGYVGHLNDGTQVTGTYDGSSSVERGTVTPSSNTLSISFTVTREITGFLIINETNAYSSGSGVRTVSLVAYDTNNSTVKCLCGSNSAGTSGAVYFNAPVTISQSDTTVTVTSKNSGSMGYFVSGVTYRWIAW